MSVNSPPVGVVVCKSWFTLVQEIQSLNVQDFWEPVTKQFKLDKVKYICFALLWDIDDLIYYKNISRNNITQSFSKCCIYCCFITLSISHTIEHRLLCQMILWRKWYERDEDYPVSYLTWKKNSMLTDEWPKQDLLGQKSTVVVRKGSVRRERHWTL